MITQHNQRVFFGDNGALQDITLEVNPYRKGIFPVSYTAGEDYIYCGVDLPFNHKYFDMTVANTVVNTVLVEIWDGTEWCEAIDILDDTANSTTNPDASLGESGIISFKNRIDNSQGKSVCNWQCDDTDEITDLTTGPLIYSKYWIRFSWDVSFTATINHVGQLFNDDDDLYGFYPDLNNQDMKDCFEPDEPTGTKADWIEQEIQAVESITREMRARHLLWSPNQILDFEILRNAAIHKTAELIYSAFGTAYEENRKLAQTKYKEAFNLDKFNIDKNRNSNLDCGEDRVSTQYLRR